jgi:hypothetical protein
MRLKEIIQEINTRIAEDKKRFCCGKKLTTDDFKIIQYNGFKNREVITEFECSACGYDENGDYWNIKRAI